MIYISLTTIPERFKNLNKTISSLLSQKKKADKIFINIPKEYTRFKEIIANEQIPKFNSDIVEIIRCEDYGPGTKILGSLKKLKKDSLVILVDDDNVYKDYMIEKFFYFHKKAPNNAYSFYVHPLGNFGVGQGADGFAINTNHLDGINDFYERVVKDHNELFLHDDLWISFFLYFIKKNKILSLQEYLEKDSSDKSPLIYDSHIDTPGLISNYGKNLNEAVIKRDEIALKSLKYMINKVK
tara:strand:- start:174 stop:893 length:720 start_codon:yes stop_codon:yes gene_type:complete